METLHTIRPLGGHNFWFSDVVVKISKRLIIGNRESYFIQFNRSDIAFCQGTGIQNKLNYCSQKGHLKDFTKLFFKIHRMPLYNSFSMQKYLTTLNNEKYISNGAKSVEIIIYNLFHYRYCHYMDDETSI